MEPTAWLLFNHESSSHLIPDYVLEVEDEHLYWIDINDVLRLDLAASLVKRFIDLMSSIEN